MSCFRLPDFVPASSFPSARLRHKNGCRHVAVCLVVLLSCPQSRLIADDRHDERHRDERHVGQWLPGAVDPRDGASVTTVPEVDEVLKHAATLVQQERFDAAFQLWDKLLADNPNALVVVNASRYVPLADRIQREVLRLPPTGLRIWRLQADSSARKILADGSDRTGALRQIVDGYFASSLGDQAALELGCRALDDFDFITASRYFHKLADYPASSVGSAELAFRVAVCESRLGHHAAAIRRLDDLTPSDLTPGNQRRLGLVRENAARQQTMLLAPLPNATHHKANSPDLDRPDLDRPDLSGAAWHGDDRHWFARTDQRLTAWAGDGPKPVWQLDLPNDDSSPDDVVDSLSTIVSADADFVYCLENRARRRWMNGPYPRRAPKNSLLAIDRTTGKVRWRWPAETAASTVGVLGSPRIWRDRLLIPVSDAGDLHVSAIRRSDGTEIWNKWLCDHPVSGCSPATTIELAIDGRDAYLSSGAGVVFAVDVETGRTHWASRYPRAQRLVRWQAASTNDETAIYAPFGWANDRCLTAGGWLIVFASDHDGLFALDRRDGALLWSAPRLLPSGTAADWPVGLTGNGLLVAGPTCVRRYDVPSGRIEWERQMPIISPPTLTRRGIRCPTSTTSNSAVWLDDRSGEQHPPRTPGDDRMD